MSAIAEQLKPTLAALTAEDRREIMAFLAGLSGDGELTPDEWEDAGEDAELDAVLAKRMDDIRSGRVTPIPGEEFFRQLRERGA